MAHKYELVSTEDKDENKQDRRILETLALACDLETSRGQITEMIRPFGAKWNEVVRSRWPYSRPPPTLLEAIANYEWVDALVLVESKQAEIGDAFDWLNVGIWWGALSTHMTYVAQREKVSREHVRKLYMAHLVPKYNKALWGSKS